ncbi:MAG: phospho-N-acetylmuramoyl-pentapeptide-transferase [Clostridia bacterium]|nr:phospho-N-acetylmuramoyl-pentapeptide-transferase [Clostridia bacterium]
MINFKTDLLAFSLSIILSVALGFLIIPLLRRLKAGQNILGYVDNHAQKAGTSTMGGFIFAISTVFIFIFFSSGSADYSIISLVVSLCFLIVGFLDDFIKIKSRSNQGLTARQKIVFQIVISILTAIFIYSKGNTHFFIPFYNKYVNFGFWSAFIIFFVFLATTNCVNLTDGLDGLAGGVSYVYLLISYLLINVQLKCFSNNFVNLQEGANLALLTLIQAGSIIGYLLFNTFSASVFMGDTGSLYLGGIIATTAIFSSNTLFIPFLGIMFVLSGISVIVQVLVYKKSKKRVFLMAPLHHHFEYKGYSESKIVFAYKLITLIVGLFCIITVL